MLKSLDAKVSLQIGSSQVVTSVDQAVKELLENAIDAQTKKIEIYCDHQSIKVSDNGTGITDENMKSIGKRHFTSKLKDYGDLQSIRTFGFRGEAISSLCCACDVVITTATEGPLGTKLAFDNMGNIISKVPIARQKGTTVQLSNLFTKFPVRLFEFQKNLKRELAKVYDLVQAYCISFPGIRFSLVINQKRRDLIETDGQGSIISTLSKLMSIQSTNLVNLQTETKEFKINGWITKPAGLNGRADTDKQFYYINQRPVNLPQISKAVNNTFREYNMQQYPICCILINIDENLIDRNCSPDKYDVFVQNEQLIMQSIVECLIKLFEPIRGELNLSIPLKPISQSFKRVSSQPSSQSSTQKSSSLNIRKIIGRDSQQQLNIDMSKIKRKLELRKQDPKYNVVCPKDLKIPTTLTKEDFSKLQIIGQFNKGFILAFYDSKIFIIDQHARY